MTQHCWPGVGRSAIGQLVLRSLQYRTVRREREIDEGRMLECNKVVHVYPFRPYLEDITATLHNHGRIDWLTIFNIEFRQ